MGSFTLFGYKLSVERVQRIKANNRRYASSYKLWTRKGKCPACNVATGSRHNKDCSWRAAKVEEARKAAWL